MPDRARVAVVGVGELGARHARLYAEMDDVELVGVADIDDERARQTGARYGVKACRDFRELLGDIDAASVAVPTESHREVTCALLEAGVHVLVEKPIAPDLRSAAEMIELARARDRRLAVGHTERYNPAVQALLEQSEDPRFIEVHRLGSFSPRSLDIDVVLDLMIHDLDVVSRLVDAGLDSLDAVGVAVLTPRVDIANVRLRFDNGAVANVTASRVSQEKVRKLRVFERDRYVSLDYQSQEALRFRLLPSGGERPLIQKEVLAVEHEEPLRRELEDFLRAVRSGADPLVSGEDGRSALELALRIVQAMSDGGRER